MWFIGVEVEQETSAPPPKKILDPPLSMQVTWEQIYISKLTFNVEEWDKRIPCL